MANGKKRSRRKSTPAFKGGSGVHWSGTEPKWFGGAQWGGAEPKRGFENWVRSEGPVYGGSSWVSGPGVGTPRNPPGPFGDVTWARNRTRHVGSLGEAWTSAGRSSGYGGTSMVLPGGEGAPAPREPPMKPETLLERSNRGKSDERSVQKLTSKSKVGAFGKWMGRIGLAVAALALLDYFVGRPSRKTAEELGLMLEGLESGLGEGGLTAREQSMRRFLDTVESVRGSFNVVQEGLNSYRINSGAEGIRENLAEILGIAYREPASVSELLLSLAEQ